MISNSLEGQSMSNITDSAIALDFLMSAKAGIKGCAFALSETATPEVRNVLRNQLDNAINIHEEISKLMISKGWYIPNDINQQFKIDMESAQAAVKFADFDLFSGHTGKSCSCAVAKNI